MNGRQFLDRFRHATLEAGLLQPGETIAVAVSGGPDSIAMLHALAALNRSDRLEWSLHVAHLNHAIRGDAARADAEFVAAECRKLELPCTIETEDVPSLARDSRRSMEEAARACRYAFLRRVCEEVGARSVAVAQHADDQVETVLHHILRGTGVRGLGGMAPSRPIAPDSDIRVVRPMLGFRRAEIVAYLEAEGIPYRVDASNASNDYTRNRLRNVVLPLLREQVNPQVDEALLRLAVQSQGWVGEFDAVVAREFESTLVSRAAGRLVLRVSELTARRSWMQAEIVRTAWDALTGGDALETEGSAPQLAFDAIQEVLELARRPESGNELHLPADTVVQRRYDELIFRRADPAEPSPQSLRIERTLSVPGRCHLPELGIAIAAEVRERTSGDDAANLAGKSSDEESMDLDRVDDALSVRPPRPGDRMTPLGAPGSKKLSDFFTDAKIPPEERERVAIVCDQSGPIWIVGHRIADRVKLTECTRRVLRLYVERLGYA